MTVAALIYATGESQQDLAAGIGVSQAQVSCRQSGQVAWQLADLDRLAVHWGVPVPDLLSGPEHAVRRLPAHRRAAVLGGAQTVIPAAGGAS